MRNVKRMVAAGTMMAVMVFGTTLANAGIIIAGANRAPNPCGQSGESTFIGIIIAGIVAGKTGIIIAGKDTGTRCGIIIAG
jgi:hypothetical protein